MSMPTPKQQQDSTSAAGPHTLDRERLATLRRVEQRVLWLASLIIHHANNVRPNPDGTKVGGHQASSASMVSIMTALYFHFLQPGDRVAVKPHASPVFHAIQFLLGQLSPDYLTTLREFGGLQAYPSRTKDPDHIDFSTGSVGLGAVAPAFAAVGHRYAQAHFGSVTSRRFVALVGDAELDEGNVWEAVLDEALDGLDNVLLIVDLNRQSLDRVVPGIRATQLKDVFEHSGWQVLEAKYGRALQAAFGHAGGATLRRRIDEMSNEEYQALIRLPGDRLRAQLIQLDGMDNLEIASAIRDMSDDALPPLISNLGGHDLEELLSVFAQADADTTRPTIIFAYTIKGWGLPIAGHPLNHSALLSSEQIDELRAQFAIPQDAVWNAFHPASLEGQLCAEAAARLFPGELPAPHVLAPEAIPETLGTPTSGTTSSQETFGRLLLRLADVPDVGQRIVTTAPDVSVSTNLAGWINKTGVFAPEAATDYETEANRLLKWRRGPDGQHIQLGISEMNLFMLLGMLGMSAELSGQLLLPIGTVYDPFVCRGLDALIYGLYSDAKFIIVGTPSGVTLAPEGGAHQSSVTPSLGMELPNLHAYEPCYAQELEWILLHALRECCDRAHGKSTYLRLSTKPIDQAPFATARERIGADELRRQVLAGGYRLIDWRADDAAQRDTLVHIAVTGALVPEALDAAALLQREGVAVNLLQLTSPRALFEAWQADRTSSPFPWLIGDDERHAPIITVHDAAPHALAWLGSVHGARLTALGVAGFGQSGTRADLYRHFGLDAWAIAEAAFDALD